MEKNFTSDQIKFLDSIPRYEPTDEEIDLMYEDYIARRLMKQFH